MLSINLLFSRKLVSKLRQFPMWSLRHMSTQSKDTFGIDDARNIEHMIKQQQHHEHVQIDDTAQEIAVENFAKELLQFRTSITKAVQKSSPNRPKQDDKQVKMHIVQQVNAKDVSTFDWKIGDRVVRASQVMFTSKQN